MTDFKTRIALSAILDYETKNTINSTVKSDSPIDSSQRIISCFGQKRLSEILDVPIQLVRDRILEILIEKNTSRLENQLKETKTEYPACTIPVTFCLAFDKDWKQDRKTNEELHKLIDNRVIPMAVIPHAGDDINIVIEDTWISCKVKEISHSIATKDNEHVTEKVRNRQTFFITVTEAELMEKW